MTVAIPTSPLAGPVTFRSDRGDESRDHRFLLSTIAFQRSRQLREGAKARVEDVHHKATYLAVLEVLANTISWNRD
jgi:DNA-directed RNA polymerase subunit K/omega